MPFLTFKHILKAFPKTLPTECSLLKATKCSAKENQKTGGEKAKMKSQDCCVVVKPKNSLENLLSVHART